MKACTIALLAVFALAVSVPLLAECPTPPPEFAGTDGIVPLRDGGYVNQSPGRFTFIHDTSGYEHLVVNEFYGLSIPQGSHFALSGIFPISAVDLRIPTGPNCARSFYAHAPGFGNGLDVLVFTLVPESGNGGGGGGGGGGGNGGGGGGRGTPPGGGGNPPGPPRSPDQPNPVRVPNPPAQQYGPPTPDRRTVYPGHENEYPFDHNQNPPNNPDPQDQWGPPNTWWVPTDEIDPGFFDRWGDGMLTPDDIWNEMSEDAKSKLANDYGAEETGRWLENQADSLNANPPPPPPAYWSPDSEGGFIGAVFDLNATESHGIPYELPPPPSPDSGGGPRGGGGGGIAGTRSGLTPEDWAQALNSIAQGLTYGPPALQRIFGGEPLAPFPHSAGLPSDPTVVLLPGPLEGAPNLGGGSAAASVDKAALKAALSGGDALRGVLGGIAGAGKVLGTLAGPLVAAASLVPDWNAYTSAPPGDAQYAAGIKMVHDGVGAFAGLTGGLILAALLAPEAIAAMGVIAATAATIALGIAAAAAAQAVYDWAIHGFVPQAVIDKALAAPPLKGSAPPGGTR